MNHEVADPRGEQYMCTVYAMSLTQLYHFFRAESFEMDATSPFKPQNLREKKRKRHGNYDFYLHMLNRNRKH